MLSPGQKVIPRMGLRSLVLSSQLLLFMRASLFFADSKRSSTRGAADEAQ